jgi:ferric-dicitrate binding protein FerR (iron transport regulator)
MQMNTTKYILLFLKGLRGKLTAEEQGELQELKRQPDQYEQFQQLEQTWEVAGRYKQGYAPDVEAGLARLQARIAAEQRPKTQRRALPLWRAAAALALLAIAGWWLWQQHHAGTAPAFATAAAEVRETTLPDGSRVLLNEFSTLELAADFAAAPTRNVRLSGEAFFEVAHQPAAAFIIQTPETTIEVLGTAFNLRAYPHENFTEVEVQEGRVRFTLLSSQQSLELQAGERGVFYHDGEMEQQNGAALNALAWHTHRLEFRNIPLSEALPDIERYYKVKLELRDSPAAACALSMSFRQEPLQQVLKALKLIYNFEIIQASPQHYFLNQGGC